MVVVQPEIVGGLRNDLDGIRGLPNDIGDDRVPLHVDAGRAAANDVDPLHVRRRNAGQHGLQIVGLGCGALSVNQHVSGGARKTALGIAVIEGEGRKSSDHVVSSVWAGIG